ncbi:MAG: ABC transporter ATP-binding protein [Bacteroidales bacterium]|nr:ABC transporter ATP-binding protein [Bacteroidales bacterium]
MILAENIHKSFGDLEVLKGISLHIKPAEIVSIVGASGAGKTTLLQIMGTLLPFEQGRIILNQTEITSLKEKQLSRFRNKNIGFVFQFHHLLPEFTAFENVCIPAFIGGGARNKTEDRARELLAFLGLEKRLDHKPGELSGGEQQRVAVARALINDPAVIFADEPSGNLDSKNKEELHELFLSLREKLRQTIVIVTHDAHLAEMADRKLSMQDGRIIDA